MRPNYRYLKYVLRHKWYVFRAGLVTKAPVWRLIIHDWSKFGRKEWKPYVEHFYTDRSVKNEFNLAWLHHIHKNPHHWQHWILRNDNGSTIYLDMPLRFISEMVADWAGAGRAITGEWEVREWYERNKERILLSPSTRMVVEGTLVNFERSIRPK